MKTQRSASKATSSTDASKDATAESTAAPESEPVTQTDVDALREPRYDLPANDTRRMATAHQLQSSVGNAHVQRLMNPGGKTGTGLPQATSEAIELERGRGDRLPDAVRSEMEPALGRDFGSVRLHTDPTADNLASGLQAKAFTSGMDVFFKDGAYDPASTDGRQTLAHELTHVAQQADRPSAATGMSEPGDASEREASSVAEGLSAGHETAPLTAAPASVQRATDPALPEPAMEGALFDTGGLSDRVLDLSKSADAKYALLEDYSNATLEVATIAELRLTELHGLYEQAYERFSGSLGGAAREAANRQVLIDVVVGLAFAAVAPTVASFVIPAASSAVVAAAARRQKPRIGMKFNSSLDPATDKTPIMDEGSLDVFVPDTSPVKQLPSAVPKTGNFLAKEAVEGAGEAGGSALLQVDSPEGTKKPLSPEAQETKIWKTIAGISKSGLEFGDARRAMKELSDSHRDFRLMIERYGRTGESSFSFEEIGAEVDTLEVENGDLDWLQDEFDTKITELSELAIDLQTVDLQQYTPDDIEKALWIQWIAGLADDSAVLDLGSIEVRLRELKLADFGNNNEPWKQAMAIGAARAEASRLGGDIQSDAGMKFADYVLYLDPFPWSGVETKAGQDFKVEHSGGGYIVQEPASFVATEDWRTTFTVLPEDDGWVAIDHGHENMRRKLYNSDVDKLALADPAALEALKAAPEAEESPPMGPEEADASYDEGILGYDALGPIYEDDPNRMQ